MPYRSQSPLHYLAIATVPPNKRQESQVMAIMRMQANAERMRMRMTYQKYVLLTGMGRKDGVK